MAKRSPWKRQLVIGKNLDTLKSVGSKRRHEIALSVAQTMHEMSNGKSAQNIRAAFEIKGMVEKPLTKESTLAVWKYLDAHRTQAYAGVKEAVKHHDLNISGSFTEGNVVEKLREALSHPHGHRGFADDVFARVGEFAAREVYDRHKQFHESEVKAHVKAHLEKRRGIPHKNDTFSKAFDVVYSRDRWDLHRGSAFPLHEVERLYLGLLKSERGHRNDFARYANIVIKNAFRGRAVPKAVVRAKREWVISHANEMVGDIIKEAQNALRKKYPSGTENEQTAHKFITEYVDREINERFEKLLDKTVARLKKEVEKYPLYKSKAKESQLLLPEIQTPKESGAIVLRKERAAKIAMKTLTSRALGVAYDPFPEVIASLRGLNNGHAARVESLVRNNHLNKHTFSVLHTKSHLGEALFLEVVSNPEFIRRFGESRAEPLAKLLSYISAGGHITDTVVKKANQFIAKGASSKKETHLGTAFVDFLINQKYLDPTHTGGNVTYLVRLRNHNHKVKH